jgi:membrane protein implicated in regulation of membrane protease activity
MNKRINTLLFILGATVFNVLLYIAVFLLLMLVYSRIIGSLPETAQQWGLIVILILPIVISFVLYRLLLKVLLKKIDVDKYFSPLFGRRRPPRKNP